MKKALGLIIILLVMSITALCTPVRSMLGAQGAICKVKADTSNQNPYVTKGLIAMWDGEWNIAFNEHDPNATVWKDLTGNGYDADMVGGSFGDNCAKYITNANNNPNLAVFEKPLPIEVGWTVEITFKWVKTSVGGGYYGLFSPNPSKSPYFDLQAYNRGAEFLARGRMTNGFRLHESGVYNIITRHISFTYSILSAESPWGNPVAKVCYINGVAASSSGTGNYGTAAEQSSVACGIGCKDSNAPWAEFYRIAVYNRELTSDEVMHNYQIDKERFGIE